MICTFTCTHLSAARSLFPGGCLMQTSSATSFPVFQYQYLRLAEKVAFEFRILILCTIMNHAKLWHFIEENQFISCMDFDNFKTRRQLSLVSGPMIT